MIAISTKQKPKKAHRAMNPRPVSNPEEMTFFWRRRRSADLDRSGDFLLASLDEIRKESFSRGDSR
jgi:hypothetical protein